MRFRLDPFLWEVLVGLAAALTAVCVYALVSVVDVRPHRLPVHRAPTVVAEREVVVRPPEDVGPVEVGNDSRSSGIPEKPESSTGAATHGGTARKESLEPLPEKPAPDPGLEEPPASDGGSAPAKELGRDPPPDPGVESADSTANPEGSPGASARDGQEEADESSFPPKGTVLGGGEREAEGDPSEPPGQDGKGNGEDPGSGGSAGGDADADHETGLDGEGEDNEREEDEGDDLEDDGAGEKEDDNGEDGEDEEAGDDDSDDSADDECDD